VFLQNCTDLRSDELVSNSGVCATSTEVQNEVIHVQVEGVIEVTEGMNHGQMTSPLTDPGVGFLSIDCFACFICIQDCLSLYNNNYNNNIY
jgi:hypothetical protein